MLQYCNLTVHLQRNRNRWEALDGIQSSGHVFQACQRAQSAVERQKYACQLKTKDLGPCWPLEMLSTFGGRPAAGLLLTCPHLSRLYRQSILEGWIADVDLTRFETHIPLTLCAVIVKFLNYNCLTKCAGDKVGSCSGKWKPREVSEVAHRRQFSGEVTIRRRI